MTALVLAGFLVAHGLVHLAVWMPHPAPEPGKPAPPFAPDHSALLTVVAVPAVRARRLSESLAVATAAALVLAGVAVAFGVGEAVPLAVAGASLGLVLKALFFNPWLTLGVALDLLVLAMALGSWPVPLV
jgi:hypothetical protein